MTGQENAMIAEKNAIWQEWLDHAAASKAEAIAAENDALVLQKQQEDAAVELAEAKSIAEVSQPAEAEAPKDEKAENLSSMLLEMMLENPKRHSRIESRVRAALDSSSQMHKPGSSPGAIDCRTIPAKNRGSLSMQRVV